MFAAAIATFILFPQLIGFHRAWGLLTGASPAFFALALFADTLRYMISASSTKILSNLFDRRVQFIPLVGAFFAGAAANRAFSTGGAPGMLVRLLYLTRQGITTGSVAVIFLIEDIAGLVIGTAIFSIGVLALFSSHPSNQFIAGVGFVFLLGSALLGLGGLYIYRRRAWVESAVHGVARAVSSITAWLFAREIYDSSRVNKAIGEFYSGMSVARRAPHLVAAAFVLNFLRYIAGAAALYFAFLSFGWSMPLGGLVLLYTSASVLSTTSAIPGELALMGGSWAVLTLSFGVPRDVAMMALLLSRTIAFWLPVPVGLAAFWSLKKKDLL